MTKYLTLGYDNFLAFVKFKTCSFFQHTNSQENTNLLYLNIVLGSNGSCDRAQNCPVLWLNVQLCIPLSSDCDVAVVTFLCGRNWRLTAGMKPNFCFLADNSKTQMGRTEYDLFWLCQVSPDNKCMVLCVLHWNIRLLFFCEKGWYLLL